MYATQIMERKPGIRQASTPREKVVRRFAQEAERLTMAGILAARVEIANEMLSRFAQTLYERDTDGEWANVDVRTYRILLPMPWGKKGYKRWGGLRWHEADILRRILLTRQRSETKPKRPHLFVYDEDCNCWLLDMDGYPTFDAARFWLKHSAVGLEEWRTVVQKLGR